MTEEQAAAAAAPKAKPGFVLALVACGMGVLGIITPIIGLLFVLLTLVLALIATIVGLKNTYWPTVGFSVLAWVLFVGGIMTSPMLLGAIGVGQALNSEEMQQLESDWNQFSDELQKEMEKQQQMQEQDVQTLEQ